MYREFLGIGVDDYEKDCYNNLTNSIDDASRMRAFFQSELPEGYRFERSKLLSNPTATDVMNYLSGALKRLTGDSFFVFYFAGHGLFNRVMDKQYLLCKDAHEMLLQGEGHVGALTLSDLDWFYRNAKGNVFFCYDVCRRDILAGHKGVGDSGGASKFLYRDPTTDRPDATVDALRTRWSLISCGDGQLARDDGSFVDAWLDEMREAMYKGRELKLCDELAERIYVRLKNKGLSQRPESKGNPLILAPACKATSGGGNKSALEEENERLRRQLEEYQRQKARDERTPTPSPAPSVIPSSSRPAEASYELNVSVKNVADVGAGVVPSSSRPAGTRKVLTIAGVEVPFRWAPPGSFRMGSPKDEKGRGFNFLSDETQHTVKLTKGFWLAETPTTQRLWQAVMRNNPSEFKGNDLRPVENVSWDDCKDFVSALNGLKVSGAGTFRFPTEAEWEYACRAGRSTARPWGDDISSDRANYGEKVGKTTRVGSYRANDWGFLDTIGNVWERVWDWYDYGYPRKRVVDPTGPSSGPGRVLRGGSWYSGPGSCRSANRLFFSDPAIRLSSIGFRVAMTGESALS